MILDFDQNIADIICEKIADGLSLRTICKEEKMPARSTIFKWLANNKSFADQYARAREEQAETLIDEIFNIADDGTNDWMEKFAPNGRSLGWVVNGEAVQRSKIRLEARKWYASKLKPKKYGEKLELANDPNNPISVPILQVVMNEPNSNKVTR